MKTDQKNDRPRWKVRTFDNITGDNLSEVNEFLQHFYKGKFVVENVVPYYDTLIKPALKLGRHLFWTNFNVWAQEEKQPKGFITKANLQGKKEMMDWLGIHFDEVIYYGKNHCPVQILRNCVHPKVGLQIYNSAFNIHQTQLL